MSVPFLKFLVGSDDIVVTKRWRPVEGQEMPDMPGTFIGARFGHGALSQNSIFDLVDEQGRATGQALKVCKPSMAARRSLAHEWKVYKDLAELGKSHPAVRKHFLEAHRVLKLPSDAIVGVVMEKANGQSVKATLRDELFANVAYVTALLRDVLGALDVAQRVLGLAHYDLTLDNIMEHWPTEGEPPAVLSSRARLSGVPVFKVFDLGTAVLWPDPFSVKRVLTSSEHANQPPEAAHELEQARAAPSARPGLIPNSWRGPALEYSEPYCCVRFYHAWGSRQGDVFRLLVALSRVLDGTTWPVEDLECVSLLLIVLEHATMARRVRARFAPRRLLAAQLGLPGLQPAPSLQQQLSLQQAQSRELAAAVAHAEAASVGAAHGGARAGGSARSPPPRRSLQLQRSPSGNDVPGVAFVRLARSASAAAAEAPGVAPAGRLAPVVAAPAGDAAGRGGASQQQKQVPVVAEDQEAQQLLGSRRSMRRITAGELLAEPIVQRLLSMV